MISNRLNRSSVCLAVGGALAVSLVAGCATNNGGAVADRSASQAGTALTAGRADDAVSKAEAAVRKSPRDASYRALLGQAYFRAGRFESAATTLDDAMKLGDNTSKTALTLALSLIAGGRDREAVAILDDWQDDLPASDMGLALALAGESDRGVAVLSGAIRDGENSPKIRQNLAYAYALNGRWREARLMMTQDVPADQINDRISDWAANAAPENHQQRIAALVGARVRNDPGQPEALALNNSSSAEQLAVEEAAQTAAPRPEPRIALDANGELPAKGASAAPVPAFALASAGPVAAPVTPAPAESKAATSVSDPGFLARPVVQVAVAKPIAAKPVVVSPVANKPATRAVVAKAAAPSANGTHLVQLGSFSSEQGARRAWGVLSTRNPELRNYRMTVTHAVVRGQEFWRVAAAGLDSLSASNLCSSVKTRGGACFAYASAPSGVIATPQLARNR